MMQHACRTQGHSPLDPRVFRRALGNFATGVTVVTASAEGAQAGVTANSFNSVSLDPPLILWSIDKRSGSYPVFGRATHFAVNILATDQIHLSNRFARPSENRFAGVALREGEGGCLVLEGASAAFVCEKHQVVDGGDHWILIGRVVSFEDHGRPPLLYHMGAYATALPHPQLQQEAGRQQGTQAGLRDNYLYLMTQAVRSYQESWQTEQLRRGWRMAETRILLVLEAAEGGADVGTLVQQAAMPLDEVEAALTALTGRGLVSASGSEYRLTDSGRGLAGEARALALHHQEHVFGCFTKEQREAFRTMLEHVVDNQS